MLLEGIDWRRPQRTLATGSGGVIYPCIVANSIYTAVVPIDPASLPNDVEELKRLVLEQQAKLVAHAIEIGQLKLLIAKLRRLQFGRSSEKLSRQIEQLELRLEELQTVQAQALPFEPAPESSAEKPARQPLPEHLPREHVMHQPACACPHCGGELRRLGEDASEHARLRAGLLPGDPARASEARLQRLRAHRAGRSAGTAHRAGTADRGPLAQVIAAKYADHCPLYRQEGIYLRSGVELPAVDAGLLGRRGRKSSSIRWSERLSRYVLSGSKLHADDTPVPVLAPGKGRTQTGRLWAYVRDDRPSSGADPPAVAYRYSPDRKAERPHAHLKSFSGILQADAYSGFAGLYAGGRIVEAACWAHARRKYYDVYVMDRSPTAHEALERIGELYAIEREIRGQPPKQRAEARRTRSAPVLEDLQAWLRATHASALGEIAARRGDPVHAGALGGTHALRRGRPHRDRQ